MPFLLNSAANPRIAAHQGEGDEEREGERESMRQRQPRSAEIRDLMEQFPLSGDCVFYSQEIGKDPTIPFHWCLASRLPPREKSGDEMERGSEGVDERRHV